MVFIFYTFQKFLIQYKMYFLYCYYNTFLFQEFLFCLLRIKLTFFAISKPKYILVLFIRIKYNYILNSHHILNMYFLTCKRHLTQLYQIFFFLMASFLIFLIRLFSSEIWKLSFLWCPDLSKAFDSVLT